MIRTWIFVLFALTLPVATLQLDAQTTCKAKVDSFAKEKPILTLPDHYRDSIIRVVLPYLKADTNGSGYDPEDLRQAKLAHSLHYWPVPTSNQNEHLWIVRFFTAQACGPHDSCPSYLLSANAKGVRNVFQGNETFVAGAGGAGGIAILPAGDPAHPELLFLNHISASETAVGCFAWTDEKYHSVPCTPECAHFLDTPRPD